jgi:hypothetical protein
LPVQPWNASSSDLVRPILDISVPGARGQSASSRTIIILSIEVACTPNYDDKLPRKGPPRGSRYLPFLEDKLLPGVLRLLNIRLFKSYYHNGFCVFLLSPNLNGRGTKVASSIGMDGNHVKRSTREPGRLHRLSLIKFHIVYLRGTRGTFTIQLSPPVVTRIPLLLPSTLLMVLARSHCHWVCAAM